MKTLLENDTATKLPIKLDNCSREWLKKEAKKWVKEAKRDAALFRALFSS